MKCLSCLYLQATYIKFCFKRPSLLSFGGDNIIQVQHYPSDQTTATSETRINEDEKRPFKSFNPSPSMILASIQIYRNLSSNGLDLAELEPKPVDHRQFPIDPVMYSSRSLYMEDRNLAKVEL